MDENDTVFLIPNYSYFVCNPKHHKNDGSDNPNGTCTTVGIQMLLGYHNYYTDRRLIPSQVNDNRFLCEDYGNLNFHPKIQNRIEPNLGLDKIGTEDTLYEEIFNLTTWADDPNIGQNFLFVNNGVKRFLDNYSPISESVNIRFDLYSSNDVKLEITSGNPVVLGMMGKEADGGLTFHVVVAYGYAIIDGEFGYICHWTWGSSNVMMWAPESWFAFYETISINHEHSFVICNEDIKNVSRKLECTICGCTTVDELYCLNDAGNEIIGLNYDPLDSVVIPDLINGISITKLGEGVFADTDIKKITLPNSITDIENEVFRNCAKLENVLMSLQTKNIGTNAFEGCGLLNYIYIDKELSTIGNGAFVGCNNLEIYVDPNSANFSVENNILYNKDKTKIIASGKVPQSVIIPETVTEIAPYAFYGNTNLDSLYFYSYDVPNMDTSSFANTLFTAYVPYISQGDYAVEFDNGKVTIAFVQNAIHYISENQVIAEQPVYYGSYLNDILYPELAGYDFVSWHRDEALQGLPVVKGVLWEEKQDVNLYAKWAVVDYDIYYDLDGGINSADNPSKYTVNDDIIFSVPTKPGYTFTEWRVDGQAVDGIVKGTHRDLVVCAFWQANTYTVSFDMGGGNPQVEPIEVVYDNSFNIDVVPSKEGYVFEGWFDNDGIKYASAAGECTRLWNKADNSTLYAEWSVKKYQVEINDNGSITWLGASGLSDTPCDIEYGTVLSSINLVPTFKNSSAGYKDGKIFDHFEYDNEVVDWTSIPDLGENGAVITIIPIWILERHTIYFDTSCSIFVEPISALYDTNITLPTVDRNGYRFNGWYTSKTDGEKVTWIKMPDLTCNDQNNGSCQLFARYELINYGITYVMDGGTNDSRNPTVFNIESNITTLYEPVKKGYKFCGWYSDANKTLKVDRIANMFNDMTLYAKWTANTYVVILDHQGGTKGTPSVTATFDRAISGVSKPFKMGHTFKGYYAMVNGQGKQYINENMQGLVWDIDAETSVLYAYWIANTYKVTIHNEYEYGSYDIVVEATYGQSMPDINQFAPYKIGYAFDGYYNNAGKKYYKMDFKNSPQEAAEHGRDYYWREHATSCATWDCAYDEELSARYVLLEMDYSYVRMDETSNNGLGMSKSWHLVHGKGITITADAIDGYTFQYFTRGTSKITSQTIDFRVRLSRAEGSQNVISATSIVAWYKPNECVAQGTLITLADGTQVPVETLTGNEMLMVWNMITGRLEAASILFIDKDPAQVYKVINLGFSDGTTVKVISEHGFWDYDLNKYVYLRQDASKYIGHWFNKGETRVQLVSVDVRDEYTSSYSPVTYGHLCYYVNGMLSMPGGISGLFNIFEVNPDTMTINLEAMDRDIALHGLYTYDEFAELVPVSEDVFNAFNGQYLKVAVGKGLITVEQLNNLASRYAEFFV